MNIHKPVLLGETIQNLNLKNGAVVVDATLGSGGHAESILKKIGKTGKLIAIDCDENNIETFKSKIENRKSESDRIILVNDNFSNLESILKKLEIEKVDAILADLGYSSDQLENPDYGMSFQQDSPLDMRLSKKGELTAKQVVNQYSIEDLEKVIRELGEENAAKKIAQTIVAKRKEKFIETTQELAEIVKSAVTVKQRYKKIHPATQTFQAIRIEVNRELTNLDKFIEQSIKKLKSKGRLIVIAFHSLEDRIVKKKFRLNARGCICPPDFPQCICQEKVKIKIITKKPIMASAEEVKNNPRSRSAKLRVLEKI